MRLDRKLLFGVLIAVLVAGCATPRPAQPTTGSACCYIHAPSAANARAGANCYGDGCCFANSRSDGAGYTIAAAFAHGNGHTVQ